MRQSKLFRTTNGERRREVRCEVCRGDWRLCKWSACPKLSSVREIDEIRSIGDRNEVFGACPPSVFVGQWGYPRVLAGPLVPPFADRDTSIFDDEQTWIEKSFSEIIRYRISLFRGKAGMDVKSAAEPGRLLSTIQEAALSSRPVDTEVTFEKKPNMEIFFSPREAPVGPSAPLKKIVLASNSTVPRKVDATVTDTHLGVEEAVGILHGAGISQRHIARLLSIGLLGVRNRRRLVPSEWSITAIDDMLGKHLLKFVKDFDELGEFQIFGHQALANNVQILLFPSTWMFEALEAWLRSPDAVPLSDYEFYRGRKSYAVNLEGAYYATRLPILEYLFKIGRQAGAIAFLEVYREWIPLGVWRFREIAREALRRVPEKANTLKEALEIISSRLRLNNKRWIQKSRLIDFFNVQKKLLQYIESGQSVRSSE